MTNQTPADALEAALDRVYELGTFTKKGRYQDIRDAIKHAQDVAARYAVVEAERRVKLIAEAMRTLVDSDEYLIHARTECDCYAHNGARAALAEAQERHS